MRTRTTVASVIVAGVIALGCSGGGSPGESTPAGESDPKADATVTKCVKGQYGSLDIAVKVTNPTKGQASYLITAEGLDAAGNRLGEANGAANSIAAGSSATVNLLGNLDGTAPLKTCRIADVTRW